MLIVVMYHHINSDKYSNSYELFKKHLCYIKENFTTTLPKKELNRKNISKNSICLSFDDGYFDFYHYVFPLLKELNLKALLGVCPKYILEDTKLTPEIRLSLKHNDTFKDDNYKKYAPFCTYKELKEMIKSGLVEIASHSYSHTRLTETDYKNELISSKNILEDRLKIDINSLILPFGKYDRDVIKEAKKHYKYIFRIGGGVNLSFNGIKGIIYRINGDNLKSKDELFSIKNMAQYKLKSALRSLF